MSGGETDDMGFQDRDDIMNCSSSGMSTNPLQPEKSSGLTMGSVSTYKSDPFFASGWDSLVGQQENFGASSMASHSNFSTPYPHLVQYPSDSSYEMPKLLSCFGNGSLSEMVGSFGLPEIANAGYPSNYGSASTNDAQIQEGPSLSKQGSNGKRRKRAPDPSSPFTPNKNGEGDIQMDPSGGSSDAVKEQDEKRPKTEQSIGTNMPSKPEGSKQGKESSQSNGEAAKDNYIHVRARRGQATNSHSLAERVRREKISERMRLLQELVPGCNKITGKAVMLDEIINYVQSLQQQVEFLSMKLATVKPEVNIDLERILSKDILHSRGSGEAVHGFGPGFSSSQPFPHGMLQLQGSLPRIPSGCPQFPPLHHAVLDNELHNLLQMGFNSGSAFDNLGPNGN